MSVFIQPATSLKYGPFVWCPACLDSNREAAETITNVCQWMRSSLLRVLPWCAGISTSVMHCQWLLCCMQSCRRNLNTVGKPTPMPGLPELAGLVGQMAAQWEARAQQQATHMDTDVEAVSESPADGAGQPPAADAVIEAASDTATAAEATTAEMEPATAAETSMTEAAGSTATTAAQLITDSHAEAEPSSATPQAAVGPDVNGTSGPTEAEQQPAVDANADDTGATDAVADVHTGSDPDRKDAVVSQRQKKKTVSKK